MTHTAQSNGQTVYSELLDCADRDMVGSPNTVVRSGYVPTVGTSSYQYDTLHRVSDAAYSADSTTEDINLDVLGNRTTYTGRSGPQISYTHNLVNEYTALSPQGYSPQYDANGNLTRNDRGFQFEYDYENRLTAVRAPNGDPLTEYYYDALGRRNSEYRTDAAVSGYAVPVYFYDGKNLVAEYDYDTGDLVRYYVHGDTYLDERAVVHEVAENKDYAYALNDVYSVVAMVNDQAQVVGAYTYDAYGLMRPSSAGDRDPFFAFQGRPLSTYKTSQGGTLPIYDFRARIYDPILGRFMQHDPAEYADSYNLYLALGGNPLVWMDPSGSTYLDITASEGMGAGLYASMAQLSGGILSLVQLVAFEASVKALELGVIAASFAASQDPATLSAAWMEFQNRFMDAVHSFSSNNASGGASAPGGSGGGFNLQNLDPRNFRRYMESFQKVAEECRAQGKEPLTVEKAKEFYNEMIRRGYYHYRGIEEEWAGGRHINMIGPSGEKLHFPVPPGFEL